jgi:ribosomal protein S18 acetylase RimI-like enzyme
MIRALAAADAAACVRIRNEAFVREFRDEIGPAAVAAGVNAFQVDDYARMAATMPGFVLVEGDEVVGFLILRLLDGRRAELFLLYIRLTHLRRGLGRRLVDHAEAWLRRRHPQISEWVLDTIIPRYNRAFYEKLGFRVAGSSTCRYPGCAVPAIRMRRSLDEARSRAVQDRAATGRRSGMPDLEAEMRRAPRKEE